MTRNPPAGRYTPGMKVICAPDSFKGSIDAVSAARAMARGVLAAYPGADVDCCPVGDGGEGTLAALLEAIDGESVDVPATGIYGDPVDACVGRFSVGGFAYVETAMATGAATAPGGRLDVMHATSYGAGELVAAACRSGTHRLLVGLGGSATNDGGCGLAQALGIRFLRADGGLIETPITGSMLASIAGIDADSLERAVATTDVLALCDVTNPLTGPDGAAQVFAPQKGASGVEVEALDGGLAHLAEIIERDLGIAVDKIPGAGAAGGLGAGLHAFAGARLLPGIEIVLQRVEFESRCQGAALCLTGEGRLDSQSLAGKACMGVARAAASLAVPSVALVGATGPGAEQALEAGLSDVIVIGEGLPEGESIRDAERLLETAAMTAATRYCG